MRPKKAQIQQGRGPTPPPPSASMHASNAQSTLGKIQTKDKGAASSVASTVGIEPTPSMTRPLCTSSMQRYRCGVKPIPKPPAPGRRHTVGRRTTRSSPTPRTTTVHGAACVVASTVRDGSRGRAHCGAGPPCTFRYAPSPAQTPTKIILLDGTQVSIDYNTRATHSGPPQATPLRASYPRPPPPGPRMIPLYYTDDTQHLPRKTFGTLPHHRNIHGGIFRFNAISPLAPFQQTTQAPLHRLRLSALAQAHDPTELDLTRMTR